MTWKIQVSETHKILNTLSSSGDFWATSCWRLEGYFGDASLHVFFLPPNLLHVSTVDHYRILARWTFDLSQHWSFYTIKILYKMRFCFRKALTVRILSDMLSDKWLCLSSLTEIKWGREREETAPTTIQSFSFFFVQTTFCYYFGYLL